VSVHDVRHKRVVVLGLARSGLAAISLLIRKGAEVIGSDVLRREELSEDVSHLERQGVRIECGGHSDSLLEAAEYVVLSPGVPADLSLLHHARTRGIPVVGEIEVASWFCRAPIVAVTGSNGKTTTTALVGDIFERDGWTVVVAGNIGSPFSAVADSLPPEGIAVVEVSSFQLETIDAFQPEVSVMLNLSPDHLDRHAGYDAYVAAKARIFENQDEGNVAVVNADDTAVMALAEEIRPRVVPFSGGKPLSEGVTVSQETLVARYSGTEKKICPLEQIRLRGPHNLSNAAAAVAVADTLGVAPSHIREALRNFSGVEHRLERVADVDGVSFVNDSKATNVVSVQSALLSFEEPIILIAGGRDKGTDFMPLRRLAADKVKLLILIGEAAPKLKEALGDVVLTADAESMEEAVELAYRSARRGECVLLSPACASFDMYENFEERGTRFKEAVQRIAGRSKR